ncbi:SGNH/GDSL hydrolase family protein [Streptomyces sp. NPDC087659]|uniref:SGNH/GDSL hydrolase family protein n=1 Tax=Streptomyces sp. NPDC087659 TaxID=3365801 RepID=UPI0037F136E1
MPTAGTDPAAAPTAASATGTAPITYATRTNGPAAGTPHRAGTAPATAAGTLPITYATPTNSAVVGSPHPAGTATAPGTPPATAPPSATITSSATVRLSRFAALGDSLTEGVGDRVDGAWRGWAALLAEALGTTDEPAEFRNFAISGALSRDVHETQAPAALAYAPDLASVIVGVNDTLRHTFDIHDLAVRLDEVCAALSGNGSRLLTACLPDPGAMLALPAPLARPLARRQRAVNAVVHVLTERYGAVHLHLADISWVENRTLWSADRLHPGERGHRAIARRFHELLTAEGFVLGAAPGSEPEQPVPGRAAKAVWLATAGTAWVARRCTDLLPQLLGLAGAEVRHWARGTSARLDHLAENALSSALASLSPAPPLARMGE